MRIRAVIALSIWALMYCGVSVAQARLVNVDIQAQPARTALRLFGEQTGLQVSFRAEEISKDMEVSAVKGRYSPAEALSRMLAKTGLKYEFVNERTVRVSSGAALETANGSRSGAALRLAGHAWENGDDSSGDRDGQSVSTTPTQSGEKPAESREIEEILVTAQKRQERLIDVPLSISALSGEDIDRRGLVGMGDYLNSIPGVTMHDRGPGRNTIIIRGANVDPEFEASRSGGTAVGIYFGDAALPTYVRTISSDIKLVDMERVEVLRGPQGTLYGSGSLSGTIRSIPRAPNLQEFSGSVGADYSLTERAGRDNTMVQGVLNMPLVRDKLAVRAVAYRFQNGGFIDSVAGSDPASVAVATATGVPQIAVNRRDIGDEEYTGGRLSVLWKPAERFEAQLTYLAQVLEQDGLGQVDVDRAARFEQTHFDISAFVPGGERSRHDIDLTNLVLTYDVGWGTLLSSSSWVSSNGLENRDIGVLLGGTLALPQTTGVVDMDVFSQEVRLVSDLPLPVKFITGAYYENVDTHTREHTLVGTAPAFNPFGNPILLFSDVQTELEQVALFGELGYRWRDLLTLTVGARAFDYRRSDFSSLVGALSGGAAPTLQKIDERGETYKVNLSYTPTPAAHIYAQWAQGFRLGRGGSIIPRALCDTDSDGIIDGTGLTIDQAQKIKSDTLENFEVGGKFAWLDNRVVTNLSAYQSDWDDLALAVIPTCRLAITTNAGKARLRGIEFDALVQLTQALRMNVASSVIDSELQEVAQGVPTQVGVRLPGSADFNFSAGLQYDFRLLGHAAFVRGDYNYVGGYLNNIQANTLNIMESGDYQIANLRFGVFVNQVSLEAFVNNVTGEEGFTWINFVQEGTVLRPRTVGLRMKVNF